MKLSKLEWGKEYKVKYLLNNGYLYHDILVLDRPYSDGDKIIYFVVRTIIGSDIELPLLVDEIKSIKEI